MSTSVDTGAEGTLSTIVAGGGERVREGRKGKGLGKGRKWKGKDIKRREI